MVRQIRIPHFINGQGLTTNIGCRAKHTLQQIQYKMVSGENQLLKFCNGKKHS